MTVTKSVSDVLLAPLRSPGVLTVTVLDRWPTAAASMLSPILTPVWNPGSSTTPVAQVTAYPVAAQLQPPGALTVELNWMPEGRVSVRVMLPVVGPPERFVTLKTYSASPLPTTNDPA